ncbi:MAG TPA: type IV secretory system conjugative DNA transfer family protein [Patescibacteria group bacterium]|nr:type IV secretory system conjugative DNA transfer family protein [Patescibacteria group bacterium]
MTPLGPTAQDRLKTQMAGVALVAGALGAFSVVATQVTAVHFHFDPALGPDWGHGIYPPAGWIVWSFRFSAADPRFFAALHIGFLVASAAVMLAVVAVLGVATRSARPHAGVHGSARFVTDLAEMRRLGLAAPASAHAHALILAACADTAGAMHYLRQSGNEHLAVIAPTRTGKGVGPVLMNALVWGGAFLMYDPKGEGFHASAASRARFGPVWRWNPVGREGVSRFNVLDLVRLQTMHEVGDAMDIATLLVDPSSRGDWDHWKGTGFDLLAGLILHVLYQKQAEGRRACLADVAWALGDPDLPNLQLYQAMAQNRHGEPGPAGFQPGVRHGTVAMAGATMINREHRERTAVHSTAALCLALYKDPIVAANTAVSDFALTDLWNGERPGSLYITVSPDQELKLQPLLRMMLTLILRAVQRAELRYQDGRPLLPWRHRLLLLLDEFASLGTVKEIELALARIAGYGAQIMLVIQDVPQLYQAYSQYQAILGMCQTKIVYAPNDTLTAEWLSGECGTMTVVKKDIQVSGARFAALLGHVSEQYHEVSRPLITPEECERLQPPAKDAAGNITASGDVILLRTGSHAIFAKQLLYFQDPFFARLVRLPPPTLGGEVSP